MIDLITRLHKSTEKITHVYNFKMILHNVQQSSLSVQVIDIDKTTGIQLVAFPPAFAPIINDP